MINNILVEKLLKKYCVDEDITLEQLAKKKLKMSYASLKNKLKGTTKWYHDEVWQLTQILDVEMNDLLKKEEV